MSSADDRTPPHRGIVVICTKDRPRHIAVSCTAVHAAAPSIPIMIIDASTTAATFDTYQRLLVHCDSPGALLYRRASRPGLTHQRNQGINTCRALGADVIHFLDDDTEVAAGYFDAIERRFYDDPGLIGVGGVITNQSPVSYLSLKRFFLLASRRRGSVLRSGRSMMGQYADTRVGDPVEWLSGCSMSYRMTAFDITMFDARLDGYALGEDYHFGFRVSREHRLAVELSAACLHQVTPSARHSAREHAEERTLSAFHLVRECKAFGLSLIAFWWSTFGDLVLRTAHGVLRRDAKTSDEAVGVAASIVTIARRRAITRNAR